MDELTAISVLLACGLMLVWWPANPPEVQRPSRKKPPPDEHAAQLLTQLQSEVLAAADIESALAAVGWSDEEVPQDCANRMRAIIVLAAEYGCRSSILIDDLSLRAMQLQNVRQRWSTASAAAYSTSVTLACMPAILWLLGEGLGSHAFAWLVSNAAGWVCLFLGLLLTVAARWVLRMLTRAALRPPRTVPLALPSPRIVGVMAFATPLLFWTDIRGLVLGIAARLVILWLWQQHERDSRIHANDAAWAANVLGCILETGLDWLRAVRATAELVEPELRDAFERVAQRLEWGIDPLEAFSDVAPELDGICSALITTYRSGAPIAQSLFGISHAGQHQQHARNLERAEKIGALAIVPVAALQLPAFVISGVVPLAVTQLLPMLGLITSTTHAM